MNFGPVVGIDVSKRFSDMCILSPDNQIFAQTKIYHDSTSMKRAEALLKKATEAFGGRPAVVMEATSHYHLILFQFFSDCGYDVLVVNPLQSSSMKDFSIRKRKTDKVNWLCCIVPRPCVHRRSRNLQFVLYVCFAGNE